MRNLNLLTRVTWLCAMFILFTGLGSLQAQTLVSGTVTDPGGEPLIGATVSVKGTSTGTATDISGAFSLEVPDVNGVLEISYTGYSLLRYHWMVERV